LRHVAVSPEESAKNLSQLYKRLQSACCLCAAYAGRSPAPQTKISLLRGLQLTKRVVDAAKPRKRDYTVWDSEDEHTIKGFGLRVWPSGRSNSCFSTE